MKVAIVHDWLVGGGAERVVEELHHMYPEAPIYTSYCSKQWRERLNGRVVTGWLQRLGKFRKFIPLLRIWWFSHLDFSGYDLVISSSGNGEAKDIKVPEGTLHINYCHSPTHFYWRHSEQYKTDPGFGMFNPLARIGLKFLVGPLRKRDYKAAQKPDFIIANSSHTQAEIKQFYGRDSFVIHPPVDTERFKVEQVERRGFVTAGRQVPYKKTDLIIEACNQLGLLLTVIGRGPEHSRLVKMAGPTIKLLDNVTDAEMPQHFSEARAFIFASYEDFGVTPVEAIAAGTPVIAYKAGGALDYVSQGKTGEFFDAQTTASLTKVLKNFKSEGFNNKAIQEAAKKFSTSAFTSDLKDFIIKYTKER